MALHLVYEAVIDTAADIEDLHAAVRAAVGEYGTAVELVWQTNYTQEDGE